MTIVYLDYIVPGSILIPIAILLPKIRGTPVYLKLLFYFLVLSAIVNAVSIIKARNNETNLEMIHIQTILEAFLLLWFFSYIIRNKAVHSVVRVLIIALPIFCIVNLLFIQGKDVYPSYTRPFVALIFIALCMVYWVQESEEDIPWATLPSNWFVTGLLLYFSGAFFLFLFQNYLIEFVSNEVLKIVWYGHATLAMLMYILFAIGFLKWKKR